MGKILSRILLAVILLIPTISYSESGLSIIRDNELEEVLKKIAMPLYEVAGLDTSNARVIIVNSDEINAFVGPGHNLFMTSEILKAFPRQEILQGVMAHEIGHIARNHVARGSINYNDNILLMAGSLFLGVASIAAGAPELGLAIASAGQHYAERNILSYSREKEQAADLAAMDYLSQIGASPEGLVKLLQSLASNESGIPELNPYNMTHPLSNTRIQTIRNYMLQNGSTNNNCCKYQTELDFAIAKLQGFTVDPKKIELQTRNITTKPDEYKRAVALMRLGKNDAAIKLIDQIIKDSPKNPNFWEMKGQIQYEAGYIDQAIQSYRQAASLSNSPLIKLDLALVLNAAATNKNTIIFSKESAQILEKYLVTNPQEPAALRQLAISYGRLGQLDLSNLALLEEAIIFRNKPQALKFIKLLEKKDFSTLKARSKFEDLKAEVATLK